MRSKIRLALTSCGPMTSGDIYEYIKKKIDSNAKIITVYLTIRMMHKNHEIVKVGEKYEYWKESSLMKK